MRHYSLVRAIAHVGQSPCDKYACAERVQCAAKELACHAFVHFVESGQSLHPRLDMPLLGYCDERQLLEAATPTRSTFVALSSDSHRLPETRDKMWATTVASGVKCQPPLQTVWGQS